jgi:hypothetical protein
MTADTARSPADWRRAARVVALLPIAVAVLRALLSGWFPVGDDALLAVRAFDVGTSHHPLLGSWTSASLALGVDVNNPGAIYSDLCAPWMWTVGRLFGIAPATALAVGTLNAVTAWGIMRVGARIGGWRVERWTLLLVAALTWSMGSELLIDIWQPHALLLPFVLLLVLTVAVAGGEAALLPWWVGVASVVVQTHLAYVYIVGALSIFVSIELVRRYRHRLGPAARSRTVRVAAAVALAAWVQPLWEQLFGAGEGNLQRLATHVGGGDLTVGAGSATRIVAAVTALPPWWTRFGYESTVRSTPLTATADGPRLFVPDLPPAWVAAAGLLVLFGVLAWLLANLRAAQQRPARTAVVVALIGMLVALAGLMIQTVTITGLGNHQVRWIFGLAAYVHMAIGWGLAEWWAGRASTAADATATSSSRLDWAVLALAGLFTIANLPYHAHDLGPTADRAAAATLERTFDDLADYDPDGPVQFDTDNIRVFEPYSSAVLMRLRELGVDFRFDDEITVRQFGERRRVDGSEVGHVRQLERSDALLYDGAGCVLSLESGVDMSTAQEADRLIAAAAAELASGEHPVDVSGLPDDVRTLVEAAVAGDADAAFRVVADALLPVLVDEGRIGPVPPVQAAADRTDTIVARVNSTLLILASSC